MHFDIIYIGDVMKIYIGHSKKNNYINELYKPIKEISTDIEFIFPHEFDENINNNREFYSNIDIFIAEVTYPSFGLGIELGWTYDECIPIYCIYKKDTKIGNSLKSITNNFYEYNNDQELKLIINKIIKENK